MFRRKRPASSKDTSEHRAFGHADLLRYLAEVDAEMGRRHPGLQVEIVVVGGAVMVGRIAGRYTLDVDVISEGMTREFRRVVQIVAERHNLRPDWINDAAKLKTVAVPTSLEDLCEGTYLRVSSAGPRYILAMKLVSAREFDLPDCVHLIRELEVKSSDELLDLIEEALPNESVRIPKMQHFAEDAFQKAQEGRIPRLIKRRVRELLFGGFHESRDYKASHPGSLSVPTKATPERLTSTGQPSRGSKPICGADIGKNEVCNNPKPPVGGKCAAGHKRG